MVQVQGSPQWPNGQVHTATLTTATTGVVIWSAERWIFHGYIPPEVYVFVTLVVPALLGRLSAELAYRRAMRRRDLP